MVEKFAETGGSHTSTGYQFVTEDSSATGSSLQLPSNALLKGLAFCCAAEKLTTKLVTGTDPFPAPIAVSLGNVGCDPHFSPNYDSGSANRDFGVDCSLRMLQIIPKTDKYHPNPKSRLNLTLSHSSIGETLNPCSDRS